MISRLEALHTATEVLPNAVFVVTCGATSREMAATADRPNNLYLLDSMGLTTSVALGLAIATEDRPSFQVVAIDGDGSLLMNLGSLATIGARQPTNLTVLLLDNGVHASAQGVPTFSDRIDLCAVARGCGLTTREVDSLDGLAEALRATMRAPGAYFVRVRIAPGNAPGMPWLHADPVLLGDRFRTWVEGEHDDMTVRPTESAG
jgi:thiamine pyrophosphate-dependent acetolactate synthase large subunit-like protein